MSVSPARAFPVAVIVVMKIMDKENFLNNYTGHFNDKQREAVETVDGKILLLAVPGSGKTTVLVTRLGYMLYVKGISPENILTLTYTVAATNDMARRILGQARIPDHKRNLCPHHQPIWENDREKTFFAALGR